MISFGMFHYINKIYLYKNWCLKCKKDIRNIYYIFRLKTKKNKCFSGTKMKKNEKLSVFPVQNGKIKCFSGTK